MTDTLLDAMPTNDGADEHGDTASHEPITAIDRQSTPDATSAPPPGLPDKFWDSERGELRSESLIKSYQALEQKLGALAGRGVPDSADGYDIKTENDMFASDPVVNAKLHASGFSQAQAQMVYDLAAEYLSPMVSNVASEFQTQAQVDRLVQHFGGEDKWRQTAKQIKSWGQSKFPEEVFHALSSTHEGVLTMHKMMAEGGGEPGLIEGAGNGGDNLSETGLNQMMQDPRYWRDHEPAFVGRVRDGFKRLFPE
ncbi:MAG: hypothetical protein O3A85_04015 [Proteobacteria bacterium]|nr:hypothetical protein [Pseudomonadota bacterium]